MARMHQWIGMAALSFMLTGCVAQAKYNALKMERDQIVERLGQAEKESEAARRESLAYKNQLDLLNKNGGDMQGLLQNVNQQNAQLTAALEDLKRRYEELAGRPAGSGDFLPAPLSNALKEFAAQNPDLVDFDAARGIVKFKSDVTFALGSADLTPKAKDVITKFATILNSPAAGSYELMVAGHTDSTRVTRPETIAAGHKDNWYLSAHRAISVGNALQSERVSAQRLGVAGYADQRPAASNGSESGRAQNRRVEVLILPTTVRGPARQRRLGRPGRQGAGQAEQGRNRPGQAGTEQVNSPSLLPPPPLRPASPTAGRFFCAPLPQERVRVFHLVGCASRTIPPARAQCAPYAEPNDFNRLITCTMDLTVW